jgi:tetratricopeptide (TPR) repeat protein
VTAGFARAKELQAAGDVDGAIAELRAARAVGPPDLETDILLGAMLVGSGADAEVIALLEPAIARLPRDKQPRLLAAIAVSYDALGRRDDAIAACRKAIAIEGLRVSSALTLARLLAEAGEHREALDLFGYLRDHVKPQLRDTIDQSIAQLQGWVAEQNALACSR